MMASRILVLAPFVAMVTVACQKEEHLASLPPAQAAPASPKPATPAPTPVIPTLAASSQVPTASAPAAPEAQPATGSPFLSGTTEAHRKSTLTPKVSSTVTRVHVREGDLVREGQPVVTLDTRDFALRLEQAQAQQQGAKVQVDATKIDWNRINALLADKAVPQSQFDMIDAKLKGAQAQLAAADTAVAMAQKALHDAIVRAPFNGVIVKRFVNEGEYASMMPATPLVALEEIDPVDLRIQVPASDMAKVRLGDPVKVRFPSLPAAEQQMDLRLTRIVPASDPRTRTFSAIVEIPNSGHSLRSGLYAEVTLQPGSAPIASEPSKGKRRAARSNKD